MKSPDPNATNAPDQQGKPIGFSRRQLLAGNPLAAFGVAVSGLNLGNLADHFGLTLDQVNKFPKDSDGIIAARI